MTLRQFLLIQIIGILVVGFVGILHSFDLGFITFIIVALALRVSSEFVRCKYCKRSFLYGDSNIKTYINNKCKECQQTKLRSKKENTHR